MRTLAAHSLLIVLLLTTGGCGGDDATGPGEPAIVGSAAYFAHGAWVSAEGDSAGANLRISIDRGVAKIHVVWERTNGELPANVALVGSVSGTPDDFTVRGALPPSSEILIRGSLDGLLEGHVRIRDVRNAPEIDADLSVRLFAAKALTIESGGQIVNGTGEIQIIHSVGNFGDFIYVASRRGFYVLDAGLRYVGYFESPDPLEVQETWVASSMTWFAQRMVGVAKVLEISGREAAYVRSFDSSGNVYNSGYTQIDITGLANLDGQLWALDRHSIAHRVDLTGTVHETMSLDVLGVNGFSANETSFWVLTTAPHFLVQVDRDGGVLDAWNLPPGFGDGVFLARSLAMRGLVPYVTANLDGRFENAVLVKMSPIREGEAATVGESPALPPSPELREIACWPAINHTPHSSR